MELCDQPHVLAALPPEKLFPEPIEKAAVRLPEVVWTTLCLREKLVPPWRESS
jgi:hypothetical protein